MCYFAGSRDRGHWHCTSSDQCDRAMNSVSTDTSKVEFMRAATKKTHPFESACVHLSADMESTIDWVSKRSAVQVNDFRERITKRIELLGEAMIRDGRRDAWFENCDKFTSCVCTEVNGALAEWLAVSSEFCDAAAVEQFRCGGDVVGVLDDTGLGTPMVASRPMDTSTLQAECHTRNMRLLASLHQDKHAAVLVEKMEKDAKLGRMSMPRNILDLDLNENLLMRRFSVEQTQQNGSVSVRAVDDGSASGTNECCAATEKLSNDRYDKVAAVAQSLYAKTNCIPALLKCDIDAAFRRIPVKPDHRWLLWAVVLLNDQIFVSQHYALPFGCVGSVHAWNRVGAFLAHLAVKV